MRQMNVCVGIIQDDLFTTALKKRPIRGYSDKAPVGSLHFFISLLNRGGTVKKSPCINQQNKDYLFSGKNVKDVKII